VASAVPCPYTTEVDELRVELQRARDDTRGMREAMEAAEAAAAVAAEDRVKDAKERATAAESRAAAAEATAAREVATAASANQSRAEALVGAESIAQRQCGHFTQRDTAQYGRFT